MPQSKILCVKKREHHILEYYRYILNNMYHYSSSIEDSEKEFLRQHLLRNFEEPVNPLAVQLAILISKIARYIIHVM